MEKYQPMPSMPMPYPAPAQMPHPKPSTAPISYAAPVTLHASYEEINIYEQKKHHPHVHYLPPGYLSAGSILVLYILLVIILRGVFK